MPDPRIARLAKALEALPAAYATLPMALVVDLRPADTGSRQNHSQFTHAPANLSAHVLFDTRWKPGEPAWRERADLDRLPHRWRDGYGRMVTSPAERRLGVLPTLVQWGREVDEWLCEASVDHEEHEAEACTALCAEAPVRARQLQAAGPCSENTRGHRIQMSVPRECSWLGDQLEHLVAWERFGEMHDDLVRLAAELQAICGVSEAKRDPLLCLSCGWVVEEVKPEKAGDLGWFRCTGCGRAWSRLELHRMAERKKPKTLAECVGPTGLALVTLKRYREAGKIRAVGRRGTAELFDLAEVMDATAVERYKPERGARGRFTKRAG